MTLVAEVPGHLPSAEERRFQELLIDLTHEREIHRRLALGLIIERVCSGRGQDSTFSEPDLHTVRGEITR